jgi:hypothetical protein
MSLLFHAGSPGAIPSSYRITVAILLRRIGRLIDSWVAGIIARREREVANATLRSFSGDALQEIGVSNGGTGVPGGGNDIAGEDALRSASSASSPKQKRRDKFRRSYTQY